MVSPYFSGTRLRKEQVSKLESLHRVLMNLSHLIADQSLKGLVEHCQAMLEEAFPDPADEFEECCGHIIYECDASDCRCDECTV